MTHLKMSRPVSSNRQLTFHDYFWKPHYSQSSKFSYVKIFLFYSVFYGKSENIYSSSFSVNFDEDYCVMMFEEFAQLYCEIFCLVYILSILRFETTHRNFVFVWWRFVFQWYITSIGDSFMSVSIILSQSLSYTLASMIVTKPDGITCRKREKFHESWLALGLTVKI